ncbi:MAG: substrate-binding domain-containing protein, partial [Anaerolineales bacterium]|nr:substrate-binding domain-containing protein [Anaerolineales bacterium]
MLKKSWYVIVLLIVALTLVLAACGSGATQTTEEPAATTSSQEAAQPTEATSSQPEAEAVAGKVGIVLPTKDEPRWVQDETRFQEALTAAGYDVEILFSQGDSAKEKANVEDLITKGVKVIIITPQ